MKEDSIIQYNYRNVKNEKKLEVYKYPYHENPKSHNSKQLKFFPRVLGSPCHSLSEV
jgi:hypothetical protein